MLINPGVVRFFESTIRELIRRGHSVQVVFNGLRAKERALQALDDIGPELRIEDKNFPARTDAWLWFIDPARRVHNYVRYLDARYRGAAYLRNRAADQLPPIAQRLGRAPYLPGPVAKLARRLAGCFEHLTPTAAAIDARLKEIAPDIVLLSSPVKESAQTDIVKSARQAGIPVGVCIASWDNLSCKDVMHLQPDRTFLWNRSQIEEAVEFHGARRDRIEMTGAQNFDVWFGRKPTLSAQDFRRRVGLRFDRPYVAFVGSSAQINSGDQEMEFAAKWIEALHDHLPERHRKIGILIRPHPLNFVHWSELDRAYPGVVVHPRRAASAADEQDRNDYFHTLHHAAAVVGLNTSAMVEATILGKPVLTVLAGNLANQLETLHFRHLLPENGGYLHVAKDLDEHVAQLAAVLDDPMLGRERVDRFVDDFLRPRGRDIDAVEHLANGIEDLAALRPRPRAAVPWFARPASWVVAKTLLPRLDTSLPEVMNSSKPLRPPRPKAKPRLLAAAPQPLGRTPIPVHNAGPQQSRAQRAFDER